MQIETIKNITIYPLECLVTNNDNVNCCWVCQRIHNLPVGMQSENGLAIIIIVITHIIKQVRNSTPSCFSKRNENICSHKYLCTKV